MGKDGGGGSVGKLWRKHGGGYYALLAVGTFVYLEVRALASSISQAESVRDFMVSELLTFFVETFFNTLMASFWPVMWFRWMGISALMWAAGGYALWAVFLAVALNRREKQFRRELGL